jgi:hypothetical protein
MFILSKINDEDRSLLDLASTQAERHIGRTEAEYAGGQWNDADPAPWADHTQQGGHYQAQSDQNAGNAVDTSYVCFHGFFLVVK